MRTHTSLGIWRASFMAALGVYPIQLTACSGSDDSAGAGPGSGGSDASVSGTGGSKAGSGGSGTGGTKGSGGGSVQAGGGGSSSGGVTGTGGAADASSSTGGADSGPGNPACKNPQPMKGPSGEATGYVMCENGSFHRTEKLECPTELPRNTQCGTGPVGDAAIALGQCNADSDCKDQPNGFCEMAVGGIAGCVCNYGCRTDADCPAGNICACASPVGACVAAANCTVDSDCGPGALCLGTRDDGCGNVFACQTKDDGCFGNSDCPACDGTDAACVVTQCSFVAFPIEAGADAAVRGRHQCSPQRPCGTGRPFLVGGAARVADLAARRDWASSIEPCLDGLDGEARAALAAHYTDVALMEHASIAAFSRFALELLSLGAPPELLVATHAAMADETVHARDAFALASAYAGRPIGPGPLDVDRALGTRGAREIVETAILEGCLGETVAAIEAAEALACATDPAVRAALDRVTKDETRHAELAWRFIRWVLDAGAPELVRYTLAALDRVVSDEIRAAPEAPATETERDCLLAHGALDASTRAALRRRVLVEIVEPCARAVSNTHQQKNQRNESRGRASRNSRRRSTLEPAR